MKKLFYPKVEQVELSDKNTKRRLILAVVFGIIAVVAFSYAVSQLFSTEPGWHTISSTAKESCAEDLVLQYEFLKNPTSENKILTSLYSDLTESAHKLFSADKSYENYKNPRFISQNPNTKLELDPMLCSALQKMSSRREIFYAPIYAEYSSLYFSQTDSEAAEFDPERSEAEREYIDSLLKFVNSEEHISLEFSGNNTVTLHVSDEYLTFAKENDITSLIDFGWLKNAFIIDYIAEKLIENGFTNGILTSSDGCVRNLSSSNIVYPINDKVENIVYNAANAEFGKGTNIVCYRDFMLNDRDSSRYYEYSDGKIITPYISDDGLCKESISSLILYSDKKSCAELLFEGIDAYVNDEFNEALLESDRIWCNDYKIHFTGNVSIGQILTTPTEYSTEQH